MTCVRSIGIAVLVAVSASLAVETKGKTFLVEETTIDLVHGAFRSGTLTCRTLVTAYLARIDRFDDRGPSLHAIASINPQALAAADQRDREFAERGLTGPLHCVPVIVKDNILTAGWETTAGTLALKGFVPDRNATAVTRLLEAGAILLAKSNMPDLGLNVLETVNLFRGATLNPYALDRAPAGSSGGTAVAIAANFGLIGLGTDTGGSIRGPAAHASLVGMRPTFGLNSRAGVVPLDVASDTVGPIARTVEDAARVLDVLTGWDPADPATDAVRRLGAVPPATPDLQVGLTGIRVGILAQAYLGGPRKIDPQVARLFAQALTDLARLGVDVVDTVKLNALPNLPEMAKCRGLKYNLDEFLKAHGSEVPVQSFDEIVETGKFHPSLKDEMLAMKNGDFEGPDSQACRDAAAYRDAVAATITSVMDQLQLDALVYPTWSQPPQLASNVTLQTSGQTLRFASATGFPAITVPMGFTTEVLPAGLSLLGRKWADAALLRMAYAFEQATKHRRPPVLAPPITIHQPDR